MANPTGVPTITGSLAEGGTLSVDMSSFDDTDGISSAGYTLQWDRGTTAITGAKSSNYISDEYDVGLVPRIHILYTDGNDAAQDVIVTASGPVTSDNLLLRPSDLSASDWSVDGTSPVTENAGIGPDGLTTAAQVDAASGGANRISQTVSLASANTDYTLVVPVKSNNSNQVRLRVFMTGGTGEDADHIYNTTNGTFVSGGSANSSVAVTGPDSEGYYHYTLTVNSTNNTSANVRIGGGTGAQTGVGLLVGKVYFGLPRTNTAPVLNAIGDKTASAGGRFLFSVAATDAESGTTITTSTLPGTATFVNNVFDWSPVEGDVAGSPYSVTFTASDGLLTSTPETISLTVESGNAEPVLTVPGAQTVIEGNTLQFTVSATDPDGTTPVLSVSGSVPGVSTFSPETGSWSWPAPGGVASSGPWTLTFRATDEIDPLIFVEDTVQITATNATPVLAPIGNQSGTEGAQISFTASATDSDGTTPVLSATGLPTGANFDEGTGQFTWTPPNDAATNSPYSVTVIATDEIDSNLTDSETISITVAATDAGSTVFGGDLSFSGTEGDTVSGQLTATDPDGAVTLAVTVQPNNGTATIDQAGNWSVTPTNWVDNDQFTVSATDPFNNVTTQNIPVTLSAVPGAPTVGTQISNRTYVVGSPVSLTLGDASFDDPNNDPLQYTATAPAWLTVTPGVDTLNLAGTPGQGDLGQGTVVVTATNSVPLSVSQSFTVTVVENAAPIVTGLTIDSNGTLSLTFDQGITTGSGGIAGFSADFSGGPVGFNTILISGTRVRLFPDRQIERGEEGSITYTPPAFGLRGLSLNPPLYVEAFTEDLTGNEENDAPFLLPVGARQVKAGDLLEFNVLAVDPEGMGVTYHLTNAPNGATLDPGTGKFSWQTSFDHAGEQYQVSFYATDGVSFVSGSADVSVVQDFVLRPFVSPVRAKSACRYQIINIIEHAFRRCKISPAQISSEKLDTALDLLNMYLPTLQNTIDTLWTIKKKIIPLYPGQNEAIVQGPGIDLLECNLRTSKHLTPDSSYANEGDSNRVFDGDLISSLTQSADSGHITASFEKNTRVSTFGFMSNASGTWDVNLEASNDDSSYFKVYSSRNLPVTKGKWQWFDLSVKTSAKIYRLQALPGTVLDLNQLIYQAHPNEVHLAPVSRDLYSALHNKRKKGRPNQYWCAYQPCNTVINLWPSPSDDFSTDQLVCYVREPPTSALNLSDCIEVPSRWRLTIIAKLALQLGYQYLGADHALIPDLKSRSYKHLKSSKISETDGAIVSLLPSIGVYT